MSRGMTNLPLMLPNCQLECVMDACIMWIFVANSVDEPVHNLHEYERARSRKSTATVTRTLKVIYRSITCMEK
jgi:hypothetical protein